MFGCKQYLPENALNVRVYKTLTDISHRHAHTHMPHQCVSMHTLAGKWQIGFLSTTMTTKTTTAVAGTIIMTAAVTTTTATRGYV